MTIALDGWNVPGFETRVNAGIKLAGGDMSGFGSFALSSDQGVKPGTLTVNTKIPFEQESDLALLISKAKALDENGARIIYTINNALAQAYKIRKAKFDGELKTTEIEDKRGWQVAFKLVEVQSVSEREQQQLDGEANQNATAQATTSNDEVQNKFNEVEGP
ncbi:hypothetical protein HJP15_07340 [Pseudoalteromonas sp. NEC-BIFX-2020_002]|uniref:baseplate complex protein n=1 Tax=Pseudoalteromonas sp. NEC-BIFX-2020_002 TaxID=2732353 RepID=UPI00147761E3|nr:hypothetical protein [Pseudoalteromonas sp. NEC-BIFX-2020_002]NNG42732.1 hypothetical protein [Pseudoalteromonas sp. NEC-BIFX-2020_002]